MPFFKPVSVIAFSLSITLLGGCGSPPEDVRITKCKKLGLALADVPKDAKVEWREVEHNADRLDDLWIKVSFKKPESAQDDVEVETECYYGYDSNEESALTDADPMEMFQTLPHSVAIDGKEVSRAELFKTINAALGESVEALKKHIEAGVEAAGEQVEKLQSQVEEGWDAANEKAQDLQKRVERGIQAATDEPAEGKE